jgi:hypothetical protein
MQVIFFYLPIISISIYLASIYLSLLLTTCKFFRDGVPKVPAPWGYIWWQPSCTPSRRPPRGIYINFVISFTMFWFFLIGLHISHVGTIEFYCFFRTWSCWGCESTFHFLGTRDMPHTWLERASWTLLWCCFVGCRSWTARCCQPWWIDGVRRSTLSTSLAGRW